MAYANPAPSTLIDRCVGQNRAEATSGSYSGDYWAASNVLRGVLEGSLFGKGILMGSQAVLLSLDMYESL
jgi:hypothetical protein